MNKIDFFVSSGGDELLITNMTGPSIAMPSGFIEKGDNGETYEPQSIQFVGRLYDEVTILNAARAFQEETEYHLRPPLVTN